MQGAGSRGKGRGEGEGEGEERDWERGGRGEGEGRERGGRGGGLTGPTPGAALPVSAEQHLNLSKMQSFSYRSHSCSAHQKSRGVCREGMS